MNKHSFLILSFLVLFAAACSKPVNEEEKSAVFIPVDETVEQGTTITSWDEGTESPNHWIAFRKDISLDEIPASAPARIAVDSKY